MKAGGSVWVPAAHVEAQKQAVNTFFSQNGYIG